MVVLVRRVSRVPTRVAIPTTITIRLPPGSYTLPVVKPAADGALLDSDGKSLNLRDLTRGRVTVLSFIYTRCAAGKACPYATGVLNQLHQFSIADQVLAKNLRLVSMSFKPGVPTRHHVWLLMPKPSGKRNPAANGVSRPRNRARTWNPFSPPTVRPWISARIHTDPQGPLFHILRVFLIDRAGRIRNIYSSGTLDPRLVKANVKTLLLEDVKISKQ